jgi:hypothetical protein
MQLDIHTLLVVAIVVVLVPGFMGALVWRTTVAYPGRWVLGNFLAACALILLLLRGTVPDWISIVLANALAIGAALAFLQGIQRFRSLPIAWWPECALAALAIAGVGYFRYITDNINARVVVMSAALGGIGIACGVILLKEMPRERRTGLTVTGLIFLLGGAVHLLRAADALVFAPVTNLFDRTPSNNLFSLLISVAAVSWSLGFIVLTAERLHQDPHQVSEIRTEAATYSRPEPAPDAVPDDQVRQQLRRILESDMFRRSPQMERFLKLVVERSLLGRPDELKEYILGRDVFNRGENYDPRADSIVRVEAQRLRRKLREYYESNGTADLVLIDLPAGSYVAVFRYLQPGVVSQVQPARRQGLNG